MWKPSRAEKEAYKSMLAEKAKYVYINTPHAIRTGCQVEFFSEYLAKVVRGVVKSHSYGRDRGQHTFTISVSDGTTLRVKGRNLYPNVIEHVQGDESLNT